MDGGVLATGVYTLPEAAALIRVSPQKLRGWAVGYHNMAGAPLLKNNLRQIEGQPGITFINLMEARFINAFASQGVKVQSIRHMSEEATRFLNLPHPFASNFIFRTDKRAIFIETLNSTEDKKLYDLKGKNWAMHDILADGLIKDVVYAESGMAREWHPRQDVAPDVIVNPLYSFGQPVMRGNGTPTRALYDTFRAEGEDYQRTARIFDVPEHHVKQAVNFEFDLARSA